MSLRQNPPQLAAITYIRTERPKQPTQPTHLHQYGAWQEAAQRKHYVPLHQPGDRLLGRKLSTGNKSQPQPGLTVSDSAVTVS